MKKFLESYPDILPVLVFFAALAFLPFFVANTYYFSILTIILLNSLLLVSLMIIIGWTGQISLAHGATYGLGAYISGILTAKLGFPFLAGFILSMLGGAIISFIVGLPSLRLHGHYLAMATLGAGEILVILFQELDFITGGTSGLLGIPPASIGSIVFSDSRNYYFFTLVVSLLLLLLLVLLLDSKIGRALRAIKGSEIASSALGLNPTYYKLLSFTVAGAVAGAAGSLYAHLDRFVSPSTFGVSLSVMLVAMVIVGGENSLVGNLIAAVFLAVLNEYVRQYQELSALFFGAALLLTVLYFERGFGGFVSGAFSKLKALSYRRNTD